MSGPETTATVEGDDYDIKDVQVRVAAPWQYSPHSLLHGSGVARLHR
jgi:hypothetical protein